MIITEQSIVGESPEDSNGPDDTELGVGSASSSSPFGEAGRRCSGQSEQGHYIKEETNLENHQVVRTSVPCINTMGSRFTDPFQTLPHLAGGDTEVLTHHCMYLPKILSYPCISLLQGVL